MTYTSCNRKTADEPKKRREEELFRDNVNLSEWTEDSYAGPALAGRPVSLNDLIAEHHTKLHRALDEELRNLAAETAAENVEPPSSNADAKSVSGESS